MKTKNSKSETEKNNIVKERSKKIKKKKRKVDQCYRD